MTIMTITTIAFTLCMAQQIEEIIRKWEMAELFKNSRD